MLGSVLLVGVGVVAITGLLSHAAYQPDLGGNAPRPGGHRLLVIGWPTSPGWLYALNQGLHVTVGIIIVPLLLAKLWSVIPRLFAWPPVTGPVHALERIGILLLVGSAIFQFATGIANAQLYYPWHFDFLEAHYYGGADLHRLARAARRRQVPGDAPGLRDAARGHRARRRPACSPTPTPATLSRRGLFGLVGAAAGTLAVTTAGQSIGGPLREVALFAPRGAGASFPINKTAAVARITPAMVGPAYRLKLVGEDERELTLAELPRCPSTRTTCRSPASRAGRRPSAGPASASRSRRDRRDARRRGDGGRLAAAARRLPPGDHRPRPDREPHSLLALEVNGAPLSLDHGFPARIIVPALPGVHCTKWVKELHFT